MEKTHKFNLMKAKISHDSSMNVVCEGEKSLFSSVCAVYIKRILIKIDGQGYIYSKYRMIIDQKYRTLFHFICETDAVQS